MNIPKLDPSKNRVTVCTHRIGDRAWSVSATVDGKTVECRTFKGTREDAVKTFEATLSKLCGS